MKGEIGGESVLYGNIFRGPLYDVNGGDKGGNPVDREEKRGLGDIPQGGSSAAERAPLNVAEFTGDAKFKTCDPQVTVQKLGLLRALHSEHW